MRHRCYCDHVESGNVGMRPRVQWGKLLLRIGEATNPGPAQSRMSVGAAQFQAPHRPGFHGALLADRFRNEDADAASEVAGLAIVTCNATSWGAMRRFLRRTKADVILAQEHHLAPAWVPAKSAWAIRAGWHSVFAPAQPGEGQGWRAGVAIFARPHLGLSLPRAGSPIIIPHRAVAACIEPPGHRMMTLVSLYLEDGKGIGADNMSYLGEVGKFVNAQGDKVPYVIGGDTQCTPEQLAATGFASQIGG